MMVENPGFLFVTTEDGSPTLRFSRPDCDSEAMHSLRGAFGETLYIYGTAVDRVLDLGFSPKFLCLGLGLGYMELLIAARVVSGQVSNLEQVRILSYESDSRLRDHFTNWLFDQRDSLSPGFADAYDRILGLTASHFGIEEDRIRRTLAAWLQTGQFELRGAMTPDMAFTSRSSGILFDAFSSKTTPELWNEEFLKRFLQEACERTCVFATYACTGRLKRSLREAEFELHIREGYASKRDSTLAIRHR